MWELLNFFVKHKSCIFNTYRIIITTRTQNPQRQDNVIIELDWIGKTHKHTNKPTWLQNIVEKKIQENSNYLFGYQKKIEKD